ncbi:hypothetical protein RAS1_37880 [Phycisphaerae bacterium RAS1]|nr:hypothetical protein RAS1_37880 [Phycisphaerae bacterium RAS1]
MEMLGLFGCALVIIGLFVYFLPTIVAVHRNHYNTTAIFALNLLLGWSFVGWVVALVWSLTAPPPAYPREIGAPLSPASGRVASELDALRERASAPAPPASRTRPIPRAAAPPTAGTIVVLFCPVCGQAQVFAAGPREIRCTRCSETLATGKARPATFDERRQWESEQPPRAADAERAQMDRVALDAIQDNDADDFVRWRREEGAREAQRGKPDSA